jgi:hypothetical protein
MLERLNAMVPFKLRAREVNSKLSPFHRKLIVKYSVQTKKRNLSQMRRASSASSAMALKSTRKDSHAVDAMALATSRTNFILILSRLLRRRSNPILLRLSKDSWSTI